jgi:hypothetical protein
MKNALTALALLFLTACAGQHGDTPLATGKIVHVGADSFTLRDEKEFYFIQVGNSQKPALKGLREGQTARLYGRVVDHKKNGGSESKTIDPYEIALDNGQRIRL